MSTETARTFYVTSREALMNLSWRLAEFSAGLNAYEGIVIKKAKTVDIPMFDSLRKFLQSTSEISWERYSFVPTVSHAMKEYVKSTTDSRFKALKTLQERLQEKKIPLPTILEAKEHIQILYGLTENELREEMRYANSRMMGSSR